MLAPRIAALLLTTLPGLRAQELLLGGRVVDASGAPIAGASVLFQQHVQPFGESVIRRGTAGDDGRFELRVDAAPGVAGIVTAQRGFLLSPEPVAAVLGGPDVEIVICEGASLRGRIAGAGPHPENLTLELRSVRAGGTRVIGFDASGELRADGLVPGGYEMRLVLGDEPVLSLGGLALQEGETARPAALDPLALPPLPRVDVHVRTTDGRAAAPRLEWRPTGALDAPWHELRATANAARPTTIAALAPALDVRAWSPGLRPAEARGARGSVALVLEPGFPVVLHLTRALDFEGAETCRLALVPEADPRARGTSVTVSRGQNVFASTVSVPGRHAVRLWHDPSLSSAIPGCESPFDPPTLRPSSFEELVLGYVLVRDASDEQALVLEPSVDVIAHARAALAGR